MNSLERLAATITFGDADRVPVVAQVFAHAATVAGVDVDDYVRDGETIARCQIAALKRYGYDAVFSVMDVNVETEAVGSVLDYRSNQYPIVKRHAFSDNRMTLETVPDPNSAGRMPEMLKALRILRRELGDEVPVVGCVLGPFTLATQLLGLENALYLAIDDPGKLESVMDFATDVVIEFGKAQIDSGAHLPVVFDPSASPAVVPSRFFREFELPRLGRLFEELSSAGALAKWLHIAGPAVSILPYYADAGATIANFDYCVTPQAAMTGLPGICVNGNIKSLSFVESKPSEIALQAANLLDTFQDRNGFILSSGCEIPPESSPENIAAMVNAVRMKR